MRRRSLTSPKKRVLNVSTRNRGPIQATSLAEANLSARWPHQYIGSIALLLTQLYLIEPPRHSPTGLTAQEVKPRNGCQFRFDLITPQRTLHSEKELIFRELRFFSNRDRMIVAKGEMVIADDRKTFST